MDNGHRKIDPSELASHSAAGGAIIVLLCTVMIVATLVYGGVDTGMLAPLSIFSAVIVGVWGWHSVRTGKLSLSRSPLTLPLIAMLLIGLFQLLPLRDPNVAGVLSIPASSSLSLDPYATRFFLVRLFLYLVFFLAALTFVDTEKRLKTVSLTVVIFGALTGFYGILQWLENPSAIYGLRTMTQAKPFGPFINQHHFAALMEMTGGVTLGLMFGGVFKSNRLPFLAVAIVVMGMSVVLTGSRGGLLSFVCVVGFCVVASGLSRGRVSGKTGSAGGILGSRAALAGGVAIIVLVAVIAVVLGGGESLVRGAGLSGGTGDFTSGRAQIWRTSLDVLRDHPFLGVGFDALGVAYTRYDAATGLFRVEQAHNDYLQMLTDAGIPGILCVLAFLYLLFSRGIKLIGGSGSALRRSVAVGALAGCFGIAIHSFFDFPLRTPANAYFFLMLSALATVEVAERHTRRRSRSRQTTPAEVKVAA
jgi:O-antigen ligase